MKELFRKQYFVIGIKQEWAKTLEHLLTKYPEARSLPEEAMFGRVFYDVKASWLELIPIIVRTKASYFCREEYHK